MGAHEQGPQGRGERFRVSKWNSSPAFLEAENIPL